MIGLVFIFHFFTFSENMSSFSKKYRRWKLSVFSSLRRLEAVHLVAAGTLCNFDKGTDQTEYFDENVLLLQGSASTEDESSLDMFSMYEYGDYRLGENSTVFLFPHLVEDEKTDGQYRVYRGSTRGSTRATRSSSKSGTKRTSSQVKRTSNKIKWDVDTAGTTA